MSRIHEPHKVFFPHGNPFGMILTKGSSVPRKLLVLLNKFEGTLAGRLKILKPTHEGDIFSFSWMVLAMKLLSETYSDIKSLITELELPVYDWGEKWIDLYLDNSVKLLDVCIGLSSELSRISHGELLLHLVSSNLVRKSSNEILKAKSSIVSWRQHIAAGNVRIDDCVSIVDKLMESPELPKAKNSAKGKVLMRAMYGVKMQTLFVCSVFISAFTGSDKKLMDLRVSGMPLWDEAFNCLQTSVYGEIRNLVSSGRNLLLKELEAIDITVNELYPMIQEANEPDSEAFQKSSTDLRKRLAELSSGLDLLTKEVDRFFDIVMNGRNSLLCNLRVSSHVSDSPKKYKRVKQVG